MKRVQERPEKWTLEALRAYDGLQSLDVVDRYFLGRALQLCPPGGRVLDIGSGTGKIISLVNGRYEKHAIDLDPLAVEFAKQRDKETRYQVASSEELPYADGFFDLVMCHSLLHHVDDSQKTIKEALRVVKPGGALFFRDLSRPESEEELQKILRDYAAGYDAGNKKLFEDSLRSSFTLREWKALFPKGFRCSKLSFYLVAEKPAASSKLQLPGACERLRFKRERRGA